MKLGLGLGLGKYIRPLGYSLTPETEAFVSASGISPPLAKTVDRYLVRPLLEADLWNRFHNIYPFVGGTASAHAVSLTHPGARDMTWFGTITHDATGVKGDGVTGYGTMLPTYAALDESEASFGFYVLQNGSGALCGIKDVSSIALFEVGGDLRNFRYYTDTLEETSGVATGIDHRGFTQTSTSLRTLFKNGSVYGDVGGGTSITPDGHFGSLPPHLLCRLFGNVTNFSSAQMAMAMVMESMTLGDHQTLNTIVQGFQTALGRAYTP